MKSQQKRNNDLENNDKNHIWHPFTQMQDYIEEKPLIIEKGDGNYLMDIEGNRYLDGVSSLWTNVHGHRKEKIDNAIREQLDKISHTTLLGLSNIPAIECAKKLVEIAPDGLNRVFYSDSGSTAVEIAIKMAFQYHRQADKGDKNKNRFISMVNSYHGDTIGSVSVGGIDLFHEMYNSLLFQSIKIHAPYCYRCHMGLDHPSCNMACLKDIENVIKKHAHEAAALIIEPMVLGAAGMLLQPRGFLSEIRRLCTEYNIFMITDEVATGFGKTGKMFACGHEDVKPDIMTVAKGISGGYLPLAATLTTDEIYNGFLGEYKDFKTFFHGHTYTGNPLACAAAIANMKIFTEENVLNRLKKIIDLLVEKLQDFTMLEHVGDVRQSGIMVGIELVKDKKTKAPYPPEEKIGHRVILEAREMGVIIRPLGNVIVMMPPLSITIDEIKTLCDVTYKSIKLITETSA